MQKDKILVVGMVTTKRHCQRHQLYSVYQKGFEKAKQKQS